MRFLRLVRCLIALAISGASVLSNAALAADPCETVGRRVYELCMASPNADATQCLREYDAAYLRCTNPPESTPPPATASVRSQGVYRIPYATGEKVHVNRDFYDHNPPGKIDMHATGGGPHRIVAAADGQIRFIVDSNFKQLSPLDWLRNGDCINNYVWIAHDNGEWTKYTHMQQGTTTGKAGLKVGDRVKAGTYLGDEGHVGCAAPAHLHFEVVVPSGDDPQISDLAGGLRGYSPSQARNPVFCGVEGGVFQDGENYFAAGGADCTYEGSVPLYGRCGRDIQCTTGSCNSDGTCQCASDNHCKGDEYCDKGTITIGKNHCAPKKADNAACELVGGGHQCQSGKCYLGHCYTSKSVAMGGTCYLDDACKEGKCTAIDGAKGSCVCKDDNDCDKDQWCDAGFDTKINACRAKLKEGESCAGVAGNDHKCKSGNCSGFPNYKCK